MNSVVSFTNVDKCFVPNQPVISELNLELETSQTLGILGRSGVGKSTILRLAAGLEKPSAGKIDFQGNPMDGPNPLISMVSQSYSTSLFPWLTVGANLRLALRDKKLHRTEQQDRILQSLSDVQLSGIEKKYPWELSGGMQQRISLARSLLREPQLLLLDEPFASLDAIIGTELRVLTRELIQSRGISTMLVTHDVDEAIFLSNRILVLGPNAGKIMHDVAEDSRFGQLDGQELSSRYSRDDIMLALKV